MKPVIVVFRPSSVTVEGPQSSAPRQESSPAVFQRRLHNAAKHNDVEALLELVKRGAILTQLHSMGNTLLHTAAFHGSTDFMQELTRSLPSEDVHRLVNRANQYGSTPLHSAAKKGHSKAIELLLTLGANPNIEDHRKRTPLKLAIESKCAKAVELLKNNASSVTKNASAATKDAFIPSRTANRAAEPLSDGTQRDGSATGRAGSSPKRFTSALNAFALNPFAQSFSPRSASQQRLAHDLQLPAESELVEQGDFFQPDQTNEPESSIAASEQGSFPTSPVQSGRLNIFTGQWDDPFLPQQTEEVVLRGLSILHRINTKRPLEEAIPASRSITRNPSGHNIFLGHSDPFTPVDRPEEATKIFSEEGE
jgi:hypothetical protein